MKADDSSIAKEKRRWEKVFGNSESNDLVTAENFPWTGVFRLPIFIALIYFIISLLKPLIDRMIV